MGSGKCRLTVMIERNLNAFGMAMLGVVMALTLAMFPPAPIACDYRPRVRLPWATTATPVAGTETDLEIVILTDRRIYVGQSLVPADQLKSELGRLASYGPDRQVMVRADGAVSYAAVEDVLAAARDAGFERLSLLTFRGPRVDAWRRRGDV
jgi:biopolymer transport protein ExbD